MSWFVRLELEKGGYIHVRPEMVKAIYDVKVGPPPVSNIVVDGHDFEVIGASADIMTAVEWDMHPELP